jgi:lipopolysaccharide/colanic/teichoic acid biosynthesis glycosyltransferase
MLRTKVQMDETVYFKNQTDAQLSFRFSLSSFIKRVFDFTASLLGLIILFPFFALIAIMIKLDSPGPVFYWGPRVGRSGSVFRMLKFRTMYETETSYKGLRVTAKDDDRITPLGKWLRNTKLNELPQLWNVLTGEMSLVGPRPEDPSICKTWSDEASSEILSVSPGITSPASVVYRDEENMLHAGEVMRKYLHELSPDKMRLDMLYVRYRSFWLDLDVLLWTALLLIPRIKSYAPPEQLLFVGPVTRLIQRYISWVFWDFLVIWVSISVMGGVMGYFSLIRIEWLVAAEIALGTSLVFNLLGIFVHANLVNWTKAPTWESGRLWMTWLAMTIALPFYGYFIQHLTSPAMYMVILGSALLSLIGILGVRFRGQLVNSMQRRLLASRALAQATRERVLLVGSGRTAEHIAWLMDHPTYSGKFQIVGFIDDNLLSQGMKIYGSKVIGDFADIQSIVKKHDIGLIILADDQIAVEKYRLFKNTAQFSPARIVVAPDIFGSLSSLKGSSMRVEVEDHLNEFQCQHCLARYSGVQANNHPKPVAVEGGDYE